MVASYNQSRQQKNTCCSKNVRHYYNISINSQQKSNAILYISSLLLLLFSMWYSVGVHFIQIFVWMTVKRDDVCACVFSETISGAYPNNILQFFGSVDILIFFVLFCYHRILTANIEKLNGKRELYCHILARETTSTVKKKGDIKRPKCSKSNLKIQFY